LTDMRGSLAEMLLPHRMTANDTSSRRGCAFSSCLFHNNFLVAGDYVVEKFDEFAVRDLQTSAYHRVTRPCSVRKCTMQTDASIVGYCAHALTRMNNNKHPCCFTRPSFFLSSLDQKNSTESNGT